MIAQKVLSRYVGDYQLDAGFVLHIKLEGKGLVAEVKNQGRYVLLASSESDFYAKEINAQIRFNQEGDKSQTLDLNFNGQKMKGKRID